MNKPEKVDPAASEEKPFKVPEGRTAELVASNIRKAIIRGELRPGGLLPPEPRLIERYGVSRPTIREAIRILESEHLIMVQRGATGGARILKPSWNLVARAAGISLQSQGATLHDVYDVLTLIEPAAAHRAAALRPREAFEVLQAQIESEYRALGDWRESSQAGMGFHRVLLEQSASPTLVLIGAALKDIVDRHQALKAPKFTAEAPEASHKRIRAAIRSHQKLVDLIGAGRAPDAERHWRRHMEGVRDNWLGDGRDMAIIDLLD